MGTTCIIGFGSAWTDIFVRGEQFAPRRGKPGRCQFQVALSGLIQEALKFINGERRACDNCFVALDQPTIVPNTTGSRPVDRVAGSLIGFIGGGIQPANRSRVGMFDEGAPIWRFKKGPGRQRRPGS